MLRLTYSFVLMALVIGCSQPPSKTAKKPKSEGKKAANKKSSKGTKTPGKKKAPAGKQTKKAVSSSKKSAAKTTSQTKGATKPRPIKPLPSREKRLAVGEAAPDFELLNHDGKKVRLSQLWAKGNVALVFYRSANW